jgi:hypothetical protein
MAYVNFIDGSDALKAFKKGKNLQVLGAPVVCRFRFVGKLFNNDILYPFV